MRCDPELLWTLVHQHAEPNEQTRGVFAHVASCDACRQTLDDLAGGATWIEGVGRWLVVDDLAHGCEDGDSGDGETAEGARECHGAPVDVAFLAAPTHPEMLGRIGRYDVEAVLGRGGMGVVLRGFDSELQRPVAIKVLAPEWATSDAARRRFAREAQAAASVAHENVVPIYNVGADASPPYIVMRYIPGVTLERWVQEHGPMTPPLIIRVASQLAAGLAAAHTRGLVHRDVKPANVLVGENTERVWLTDFGLARAADEARMTRTGVIAGTPHYMSPEQARGESLDGRSDWFSLGCLIYFLCSGQPPFDAPSTLAILQQTISARPRPLAHLRPDLPPALIELVERLLRKRPDRRLANVDSVQEYLHLADQQIARGVPPRRRWMWRVGAAAMVCGILAAGAWYAHLQWRMHFADAPTPPRSAPHVRGADTDESSSGDPWEPAATGSAAGASPALEALAAQMLQTMEQVAGWNDSQFHREIEELDQQLRELERN